jgi:hypothetical protein
LVIRFGERFYVRQDCLSKKRPDDFLNLSLCRQEIYLAISFVDQTKLLAFAGEEVEEIEMAGFSHAEQSLLCANLANDNYLQVGNKLEKV